MKSNPSFTIQISILFILFLINTGKNTNYLSTYADTVQVKIQYRQNSSVMVNNNF